MSDACLLKPDRQFIDRIVESGGDDLKKCFQCATCSAVCDLAPDRRPFPRKEMHWAQWGLKERLLADPDVWLCHQCNDCSTHCPRGARPADVLAAIRHQSIIHHAVPGFLANWVNRVKFLPLTLLISAVFVALALIVRTPLEGVFSLGTPHGFYAEFFPHWLLIGFYTLFTGLAFLVAAAGIVRFWRALKAADDASGNRERVVGIIPAVIHTLKSLLVHDKFAKCVSHSSRRLAHLMVFYGFVALFLVTVWAVFDMYVKPYIGWETVYPFDLAHPMKFLGNAGALLLVIGCLYVIRNRMGSVKEVGSSTSFDWIFVLLLLSVGVTGILTEALRFVAAPGGHAAAANARTGLEYTALAVYFVHLVLVFELLVFLPYSKFAHLLYRTTAQVYAEHSGRNLTARELALSKQDARSPTGVHSESDEESQAKESLGVLSPRTSEART